MIRENIEILVSEISLLARANRAVGYWDHLRFNEVKKESIDFELLLLSEKNSRLNVEQRALSRTKIDSTLSFLISTLGNRPVE
jgi:hypothetical protein